MIVISATFTAEPLKPIIENYLNGLQIHKKLLFAPYNQTFQQLLDPNSHLNKNIDGINIILIRLEDFISKKANKYDFDNLNLILNQFLDAVSSFSSSTNSSLFIYLCHPSSIILEDNVYYKHEKDFVNKIKSNKELLFFHYEEIKKYYPTLSVLDKYAEQIAHIPYTEEYFGAIGTYIARKIYSISKAPYKVIILDCDNTLWQGVCGEVGYENIIINSPQLYLQKFILKQFNSGMLICLCSKNNEEDVLDVFANRSDMLLKLEHIVVHKINWDSKSKNIDKISQELNLSPDSFIFIDDNPLECAEVEARLPDVLCLTLPSKTEYIKDFLNNVWSFDNLKITSEDKNRTKLYKENNEREIFKNSSSSFAEFIKSLDIKISFSVITSLQIERVSQLTFRTNQFNLSTIRYSEPQLIEALNNYECITIHVSDKFGEYGLVGVIFYSQKNNTLYINNILISCRVLGKGIEHKILNKLGEIALEKRLSKISLQYIPSLKNQPALIFLNSLQNTERKTIDKITYYIITSC